MANANVLELMAQYDFNSPINITLLFDDSDDDLEIMKENKQKEYSDTDNNLQDNTAFKENDETKSLQSETNTQKKSIESNESLLLNVAVMELQNNKSSVEISNQSKENDLEKNSPNGEVETTSNTLNEPGRPHGIAPDPFYKHPPNVTSEALSKSGGNEYVAHHNYPQKPASLLDDLLNMLSEHIILIMHAFYRYRPSINERKYTLIKHHFFELSYNTTITIIVPQEQNKRFINLFLENTVRIANNKYKTWKCHRRHLEPFFNELVVWTKNKSFLMKRVSSEISPDANYHLKQRLNKPLQTINQPFLETPSPFQRQYTSNNVCIFTSGSSGMEINVNADTLINSNAKQYSPTVEWHGLQNNNPCNKSYQAGSENIIMSQAFENKMNNHAKNFNTKHRRRSTPYSVIQNSINNQSQKTVSIQSSQNIDHPLHEIQAKRQHINSNVEKRTNQLQTNNETHSTSPSRSVIENAVNENINNQMHRLQSQTANEASALKVPVISNVISLNPIAHTTIEGRCCVCGKTTYITCSKCNEPSYCSFLCQELDKQ